MTRRDHKELGHLLHKLEQQGSSNPRKRSGVARRSLPASTGIKAHNFCGLRNIGVMARTGSSLFTCGR